MKIMSNCSSVDGLFGVVLTIYTNSGCYQASRKFSHMIIFSEIVMMSEVVRMVANECVFEVNSLTIARVMDLFDNLADCKF